MQALIVLVDGPVVIDYECNLKDGCGCRCVEIGRKVEVRCELWLCVGGEREVVKNGGKIISTFVTYVLTSREISKLGYSTYCYATYIIGKAAGQHLDSQIWVGYTYTMWLFP